MASHEKSTPEAGVSEATANEAEAQPHLQPAEDTEAELPSGWIYKTVRIRGKKLWYASPQVQITMVAFVCFLCPGKNI